MKNKNQPSFNNQAKARYLQKYLQFMLQICHLREDSLLFHKLLMLQKNKQNKNSLLIQFWELESLRLQMQSSIAKKYMQQVIVEFSKNLLFQYSSKVYKTIKYFYMKIMNYWPNYLQISESSSFVQQVRKFSIQILSVNSTVSSSEQNKIKATVGDFLQVFQHQVKQKFQRQIKIMQVSRIIPNEQSIKSVKFMQLLGEVNHIFKFYEMAHQKLKKQIQQTFQNEAAQKDLKVQKFTANCCRLIKISQNSYYNQQNKQANKSNPTKKQIIQTPKMQQQILQLQSQSKTNNQLMNSYKEEGILQFYMNKQSRMFKQLFNKNISNKKYIQGFAQKTNKISANSSYVKSKQNVKESKKQELINLKNNNINLDNRNLLRIRQKYLTLQNDSCRNSIQILKTKFNQPNSSKHENTQQKDKNQYQCLSIKQFILDTDKNIRKITPHKFRQPLTLRLSTKQDKRQNYGQQIQVDKRSKKNVSERGNHILKEVRQALDLFVQNYHDKQNSLQIDCKLQHKKIHPHTPVQKIQVVQTDFLRCKNKRYRITSIPQNRSYKIRPMEAASILTLQAQLSKKNDFNADKSQFHQKQNEEVFISKTVKCESRVQCLILDDFALRQKKNNSKHNVQSRQA